MKQSLIDYLEEAHYRFDTVLADFPEISQLQGVPQNPQWHREGDVFAHTRNVCTALCGLGEWGSLSKEQKGILYMAALFHDIGKRVCTTTENGQIISPFHAVTGAKIFRETVYLHYEAKFAINFLQREHMAFLIRWHGLPPLFIEKEPLERHLFRARESADFLLLYLLAKADVLGRECANRHDMLDTVEYFREYAVEQGVFYKRFPFANAYTRYRYFQGDAIWPGAPLYDMTRFPVYMLSGLPLSGKDHYVQHHLGDCPVVSLDDIREEWKLGPMDDTGKVVSEAKRRAKAYLQKQQPFVWNATNIIQETRQGLYQLFFAYHARIQLIYVEAPYEELLRRNQIRERCVPQPVLLRMIRKLDMVEPTEAHHVEYRNGLNDSAVIWR